MSQVTKSAGLSQQASASAAATPKPGPTATAATAGEERTQPPPPFASAFSWHGIPLHSFAPGPRAYEQAEFAAQVKDISHGLKDLLAIIEQDGLDKECTDASGQPLQLVLSQVATGNLMRLCVTTLGMLGDEAERRIERARECADRGERHV